MSIAERPARPVFILKHAALIEIIPGEKTVDTSFVDILIVGIFALPALFGLALIIIGPMMDREVTRKGIAAADLDSKRRRDRQSNEEAGNSNSRG